MRPIDADALLKRINYKTESGLGKTIAFTFKHFIDDAPTIETYGDSISRADAIEAVWRAITSDELVQGSVEEEILKLPSADAVKLKQTDTLIIADSLRYLIQDTERHEIDRARAEELREQILQYGASMCHSTEPKWITGRKPTKNGTYMVTLESVVRDRVICLMHYGKPLMPNRKVRGECWYRSDDEWGDVVYDDEDILAWMPLPTPYKGGEE